MARHPRWVRRFLSDSDLEAVQRAIVEAEATTSAEIRVHLDHRCPGDPMARAIAVFEGLGMHSTTERHGVLIYIAIADRKLAVIGDQGIHDRVGDQYWQELVAAVTSHFRDERPRDGLLHALRELSEVLRRHFPRRPDDVDELGNTVTIGR
jgi:uncharacterized membrane protein